MIILKANLKYNICWLILMVAGFYLMNALILVGVIDSFLENMVVTIGINILAVGLNLVIGFAGQFSLGHAGFMAAGAYATAIITSKTPTAGALCIHYRVGARSWPLLLRSLGFQLCAYAVITFSHCHNGCGRNYPNHYQ